jgi:hypothetical protein
MYFFFILFFVSLGAIILMIGRKLSLVNDNLESSKAHTHEVFISGIFDFDKLKSTTIKNSKKLGHLLVWFTLRTYILSSNFLNKKRKEIILKIQNKINRNRNNNIEEEEKEVSKYIKIISEYRQKIRKIKHKIREEEGIE